MTVRYIYVHLLLWLIIIIESLVSRYPKKQHLTQQVPQTQKSDTQKDRHADRQTKWRSQTDWADRQTYWHRHTRFSTGRVSCKQKPRKMTFNTASVSANNAGDVKNAFDTWANWYACCEKYAPIRGPTINPTENATPIRAYINNDNSQSNVRQ